MDRDRACKWLLAISICVTALVYARLFYSPSHEEEKRSPPTARQMERLKKVRERAEKGDVNAQLGIGMMYQNGWGAEENKKEGDKWIQKAVDQYQKSAEKGDVEAQRTLGELYQHGRGVKRDLPSAVQFYRKAAEQGNARAQHNLGLMHNGGVGVKLDYAEAYKWYSLAAARGSKEAAHSCEMMSRHMTPEQIAEGENRAEAFGSKKETGKQ